MTRRRLYQLPAELALVVVTVMAIFSMDGLFLDRSYGPPMLLTALIVHLVAALTRRLPGGLATTISATGVALLVQLSLTYYADTTVFGIPTGATFSAARADVADGWAAFQNAVPPAPVDQGFLIAASIVLWLLVVLADWAAFRLRSSVEALLPTLGAFIFAAIFDRQTGSFGTAAVYLAAAMAFLLLHRAWLRVSTGTWLGESTSRSYGSLLAAGSAIAVFAIVAGFWLGPRSPGADEPPTFDFEEFGISQGPARTREVFSPLVDIKGRLTEQPDLEMFTVTTPRPTYYRLTALNQFDGQAWIAKAGYLDVTDVLPREFPVGIPESDIDTLTQQFNVSALGMAWLPATFQPVAVRAQDNEDVSYEPQSSTLLVDESFRNSDGFQYNVTSQVPRFTPTNLQTGARAEIDRTYLDLPADFSPRAAQTAAEIVAGKPTRFEQARALQDWFRENFVYDINVPKGHGNSAIDDFLDVRAGYCEQFAGTYAAMARSVGLASRVVIGFTHGIQDPADPTLYHVRAEHAHAWPEVFIPGAGWVSFEPTPGRGAPGTEQYTGVATAQQQSQTPIEQPPEPANEAQGGSAQIPQEDLSSGETETEDLFEPTDPEAQEAAGVGIPGRVLAVLALLVGLPLLAMAAIALLKRAGWRRRQNGWSRPETPAERVAHSWEQTVDLTNRFGYAPRTGETVAEFSERTQKRLDPADDAIIEFGRAITAAGFGPLPADNQVAGAIEDIAARVDQPLLERLGSTGRLRHEIDPGPLLRRPSQRWVDQSGSAQTETSVEPGGTRDTDTPASV